MIRRLADRLVSLDLLDEASDLLQYQVDNRLTGAAKAAVASRLAVLQLVNHQPRPSLADPALQPDGRAADRMQSAAARSSRRGRFPNCRAAT